MSPDDERHGTYAGYQRHRLDGETACGPCRDAARDYAREFRARRDVPAAQRERARQRARNRAVWRLVELHPEDFRRLVAEESRAETALLPHTPANGTGEGPSQEGRGTVGGSPVPRPHTGAGAA